MTEAFKKAKALYKLKAKRESTVYRWTESGIVPIMTNHAKERWLERFPELDIETEWATTILCRVGCKTRKRIKRACPDSYRDFKSNVQYRKSLGGVVFVVHNKTLIITVFELK